MIFGSAFETNSGTTLFAAALFALAAAFSALVTPFSTFAAALVVLQPLLHNRQECA